MQTQRWLLTASALTVLGLLWASCAPSAAPTPTPKAVGQPTATAPSTAPTASPAPAAGAPTPSPKPATDPDKSGRYGGVLIRSMNRDVPSFDLQREQGVDASMTLFNIYQGLVRLHPLDHEKIVSELAEKWEIGADGKTYTFKFYSGIKWHDGKPLTMVDVKYSLDRMQNPKAFKTVSPRAEGLLAAMDTTEIVGEDTIKIVTKYPSASFMPNIATGWVAIAPKHVLDAKGDMRRDSVGTGPFKLKEFNANVSLELEKNGNYHIKGLPYLNGVKFYTIKDDATRFSAFRTAKIHTTFMGSKGLTSAEAEIVKREMAGKATAYEHDAQTRKLITFNLGRKPWDDVRVRRAVDLAFDRQAAIKVNGKGYIGSIYVAPWGMKPEELAKLPGFRQPKDADMAEAKRLLAEAGFPNGFKTSLLGRTGGAGERDAIVVKDQLAKIGIEAELILVDQTVLFERSERRAFDVMASGWTNNTSDPDETLFSYYATGGSRNYGDFSNKLIDELIEKQARTMDAKAREALLAEIEKKCVDEVPMVIPFWDLYQMGAWNVVKNFRPGPGSHPWGKLDHVWLAD